MPRTVTLQGQYAGFVTRLIAFAIDLAVITLINFISIWLFTQTLGLIGITRESCVVPAGSIWVQGWCLVYAFGLPVYVLSVVIFYPIILWMLTGQTIGKALMGVRVVRIDGRRISFWTAARRMVGYWLSILTFGVGFLWILFDDQRQGWPDILARTYVVYAWEARESQQFLQRVNRVAVRREQQQLPDAEPAALLPDPEEPNPTEPA